MSRPRIRRLAGWLHLLVDRLDRKPRYTIEIQTVEGSATYIDCRLLGD